MRIAFFHHVRAGGSKRALVEMARALKRRGHAVDAYTLETADETFLPLAEVVDRLHIEPFQPLAPIETRWLPFAIQYLNLLQRLKTLDALDAAQARVAARIDAGGYDVAFVHPDFMVQAPYVLRHLRTPSAYYCAEPLRRYYEPDLAAPTLRPEGLKGHIRAAWYAPVEPAFARRHKADDAANTRAASLILTNSDYSREAIYKAYGRFARVGPLGVDTAKFRPTGAPKAHAVVNVGRFQANKDQALTIEAVARLPEAVRPTLILVGESSGTIAYRDHLVDLASRRGVRLELLEHVSDEALVDAYNRSKLAVFTPVMEPFGFVPLEAAACGIPTVGVREAGVRESVVHGQTGLLAERDAGALASAIAELLGDDARRERLGAQALAHVREHWSWARSGEVLEARFGELVAQARSAHP
jgi:glycosyltransferase involved in cell wall biosynthesis